MQTLNTADSSSLLVERNPLLPEASAHHLPNRPEEEVYYPSNAQLIELIAEVQSHPQNPLRATQFKRNLASYTVFADSPVYAFLRRSLDIIFSATMLVLLSPVLLIVALAVKCTSKGPVLFVQKRLGKNLKEFNCYKFRSMVTDAEAQLANNKKMQEAFNANFKLENDPRVTRIGDFMRRTSIDELPQFLNILKGDMTLVGPRPKVQKEVARYGPYVDAVWSVKPGLAGLWQVLGRSELTWQERIATELMYVNMRSFKVDIVLLWHTFLTVIQRKGAY